MSKKGVLIMVIGARGTDEVKLAFVSGVAIGLRG
jgi:hypothetical protein